MKSLGYTNGHQVPRLEKIVVTSCMGKSPDRKVAVDDAVNEIQKITGQRPSITFSKKAVANFKLREGEALGARVTLRGTRMWEFMHRFVNVTAPNIRDFRGLSSKSFDGRGNYACGISDQSIFPEIEIDQINRRNAHRVQRGVIVGDHALRISEMLPHLERLCSGEVTSGRRGRGRSKDAWRIHDDRQTMRNERAIVRIS